MERSVISFHDVELDLRRLELRRFGQIVKLERQPLELLILLVERHGQLVTREEIARKLWGNDVFVDIEQSVHTAIPKIRVALGDDAQTPRFVQTVVGKGYRFIAPIRATSPTLSRSMTSNPRLQAIVAVAVVVFAIALTAIRRDHVERRGDPPHGQGLVAPRSVNPAAYDAYLRGRYFYDKRTPAALQKSVSYFRQAIKEDPHFAGAYAGLADSLPALNWLSGKRVSDSVVEATRAAKYAIQLDPQLGEAHSLLGTLISVYEWNWDEARTELKRGVELNPRSSLTHQRYAMWLASVGDLEGALQEARRAQQLDPLSFFANRQLGHVLYFMRRYDEALAQFRRAQELEPDNSASARCIALVLEMQGKRQEAIATDLNLLAREGVSPSLISALRDAYAKDGWKGFWERWLQLPLPAAYADAFVKAAAEARLGHRDKALHWIEAAADRREVWATSIRVDPLFDSLRSDPRYERLLARMHLDEFGRQQRVGGGGGS